ncbi:VOC family protein, partial [bacterium]
MQKISPFLWFDTQAEEAARFYVGIFPDSQILSVVAYPTDAPGKKAGEIMTVDFDLQGQRFTAINGGPHFKFDEAISFVVHCDSQEEVDRYWNALLEGGGQPSACGWLKDRFG